MHKKRIYLIFSMILAISTMQAIFSNDEEIDIERYHVIKLEPRISLSLKQYLFTECENESFNKEISNRSIPNYDFKSTILDNAELKKALKYTAELSTKCLLISGCLITDSLTQYYINNINPLGLAIVAANSMFSEVAAQHLGMDLRIKINQGLLIAGLFVAPKITIAASIVNFLLSKAVGEQTAASLLSCIAADNAISMLLGKNQSQYCINAGMLIAMGSTLMPDIVEQILGISYKEKFAQAVIIAGICLAPEITIGAYALSYVLDELAGTYIPQNTTLRKAFGYFSARTCGIAGKLLSFLPKYG